MYFTAYYRDQLQGQVSQYRIRRPDGSLYWSTNHSSPSPHYAASWWYWYCNTFAAGGPDGIWTFEIDYQGKTHTLPFVIGSAPAGRVPGDIEGESPLTVTRSGAMDLVLEWSPSCGGADTDFEIYEGTLGDYDSHVPVVCTTRGATRHTLTPSAGDVYYLVVPTNGSREGSHGLDGAGFQRPAGAASYPESFVRLWEYYLCYCEGAFLERYIGDVQVIFTKPGWRNPTDGFVRADG